MLSLLESAIDERRTLRDRANGHRDRRTCERKDPHRPWTEHADGGHADNAESLLHADVAGCQPDEGPKQEVRDEADPLGARRRTEPLPSMLLRRAQFVVDLAIRLSVGRSDRDRLRDVLAIDLAFEQDVDREVLERDQSAAFAKGIEPREVVK